MSSSPLSWRILILVTMALLTPSLAAADTCNTQNVTVRVTSDGTLPGVEGVGVGNMVTSTGKNGESSCQWQANTSGQPTYTWTFHPGHNPSWCTAFALEFNYRQKVLGPSTAIGVLNLDPTVKGGLPAVVDVVLSNCQRAAGNCLLRVDEKKSTAGNGVSYGICSTTKDCTLNPSCRLTE